MTARASLKRVDTRLRLAAQQVLLVVATIALAFLTVRTILAAPQIADAALVAGPAALLLGAAIYLTGHALRILRLALLIGGWRVGFREITAFHLTTASVSLAAPMKLGEIYRVVELAGLTGSFMRAVMIAWYERVFDVVVVLCLLIVSVSIAPDAAQGVIGVAAFAALFIAITGVIFFLAPDNLRRLSVLIIRRYDSPRTVGVLHALDVMRRAILSAPAMARGKTASLTALTLMIWLCEIVCFVIVLPTSGALVSGGVTSLLSFLSQVTAGDTLIDILAHASPILTYLAATQIPLLICGLVAACYYIPRRLRS